MATQGDVNRERELVEIEVLEVVFEKHNDRREELGLSWEAYLEKQGASVAWDRAKYWRQQAMLADAGKQTEQPSGPAE